MPEKFYSENCSARLSNLLQILTFFAVLPVSTALCQEGFNFHNRIKATHTQHFQDWDTGWFACWRYIITLKWLIYHLANLSGTLITFAINISNRSRIKLCNKLNKTIIKYCNINLKRHHSNNYFQDLMWKDFIYVTCDVYENHVINGRKKIKVY